MKEHIVPEYILKNALDGLRLAANALESRKRETAMDRQIDYAERLLRWVLEGQKGKAPNWIPKAEKYHLNLHEGHKEIFQKLIAAKDKEIQELRKMYNATDDYQHKLMAENASLRAEVERLKGERLDLVRWLIEEVDPDNTQDYTKDAEQLLKEYR